MTTLTQRYLAAVLRGIPDGQRADVERELRSSIADAVEDRVAAGEERAAAEKAVLEGLGNPSVLAAGYSGRPMYLIGPDLFPAYRHIVVMLTSIAVPIVALVVTVAALAGGAGYADGLLEGVGGAFSVGVQLAFWITVTFVAIERFEVMREARTEIAGATSRWTVDMLPADGSDRVTIGETVGEVFTTLIGIGGLLFLRDTSWFTDGDAGGLAILDPDLSTFWLPILIAVLASIAGLQVIVYLVGRWTMPLAAGNAALQLAFSVPVVALALNGALVNPAFAAELGWPELPDGDGTAMLILAAAVTLVTAWEILDAFRRARRSRSTAGNGSGLRERAA